MTEKRYKTAFYIMTAVVVLLLIFFVGMRIIDTTSENNYDYYSELTNITNKTETETESEETVFHININTASAFELTALPGIGETKANAIIEFRNEYGKITEINDLLNVKGIGETILKQIEPYIIFDDE